MGARYKVTEDMPVSMLQTTERFTRLAVTSRLRRGRLTTGSQSHPPTLSPDNNVNILYIHIYIFSTAREKGK